MKISFVVTNVLFAVCLSLGGCMLPTKGAGGANEPGSTSFIEILNKVTAGLEKANLVVAEFATVKQDFAVMKAQATAAADTNKDGILDNLEKPAMMSGLSVLILNYLRNKSRKVLENKVDTNQSQQATVNLAAAQGARQA